MSRGTRTKTATVGLRAPGSRRAIATLAALLVMVALGSCAREQGTSLPPTVSVTRSSASPSPAPTTTSPTTPGTVGATTGQALQQLQPFLVAATAVDSRLQVAARAINAAGPPWNSVSDSVARAVRAADPSPVATTMRAGADPELLARMLLVYSDLVSRRAAMAGFEYSHEVESAQEHLLVDLGKGGPAAARFAADLASLRARAARTVRFTPQAVDSRASADLQLMVRFVDLANQGCEGRGGVVVTELPTVVWRTSTSGVLNTNPGFVGFLATRHPGHPWTVELLAC